MTQDNLSPRIAVVGCGYWGKNLVRNFHQLGALALICETTPAGRTGCRSDRTANTHPGRHRDCSGR